MGKIFLIKENKCEMINFGKSIIARVLLVFIKMAREWILALEK